MPSYKVAEGRRVALSGGAVYEAGETVDIADKDQANRLLDEGALEETSRRGPRAKADAPAKAEAPAEDKAPEES